MVTSNIALRMAQGAATGFSLGTIGSLHQECLTGRVAKIADQEITAQIEYNTGMFHPAHASEERCYSIIHVALIVPVICAGIGAVAGLLYGIYENTATNLSKKRH